MKLVSTIFPVLVPALVLLVAAPHAVHAQATLAPEPVTLDEAIKRALVRNVNMETARFEIARAEALVEQARAQSLPTLLGSGTYTRLDDDRRLADRIVASKDALNGTLTLNAPLVAPRAWGQWSHAKDNVRVATALSTDVRRQVGAAVARAYLAVIVQKRVLEVSERARDAAKAHYEFAHQRFVGGVGNRIDEVRAQQEFATDEAQVQTARTALARAREALGVVTGTDKPLDATNEPAFGMPASPRETVEAANKRSDVRVYAERQKAAEAVLDDSWRDYMPLLSGVFQPFYQNPPTITQPQTGWQAQLVLTLPIFDGGFRYGATDERRALVGEAKTGFDAQLRQAKSEIRMAFEAVEHADSALLAARQASDLARQALQLAEIAYRAGATTNIEVIDAERRARDAETQTAVSEDTARQARLDLLVASGRYP